MFTLSRKDVAPLLGVALLYFLSARLGLMLSLVGDSVTLFWPASGIALTALLVFGLRIWPGIFLGALLGNYAEGFLPSLEISCGATIEAMAAAALLLRIPGFSLSLVTIRDIFILLAVAAFSSLLSALNGPFWLWFNQVIPGADYPGAVVQWWMGDALGIMLFAPLLLAWARHAPLPSSPALRREEAAYFASLLLLGSLLFSDFGASLLRTSIGPFMLLPIIVMGALRFNMRLTALGCAIVFLLSMAGMVRGTGVFAPVTPESIRDVWTYNLVLGMTGLILSIANEQRRRINLSLEASEAELKRAQVVAKTGSWQLDLRKDALRWSDETYRIFGMASGAPLTFGAFLDRVHPDDREFVAQAWQAALHGGLYEIEHRILADGRVKWVQATAEVDFDEHGQAIAAIGTVRDITAFKEAEKRLHLAAKVFENSGEGIMITDAEARVVAVNRAFTEMSGYGEAELVGKSPRMLASGRHDETFYRGMWETAGAAGNWQGEVWERHKSWRVYPKWMTISAVRNALGELTNYIAISTDITERKNAEQNIHMLAYFDVLTGLPNRTLLNDRMAQMLAAAHRDRQSFSVLLIDLDRFKYVNDSLGHEVGDCLLKVVAQRLQSCVREGDTVARSGGDEFVILLRETDATGAAYVAEKILHALSAACEIGDMPIFALASIGISIYPDNAADGGALLKHADVAMYRAKDQGRNNFQFFAPEMNAYATQLFSIEKDLRLALERGEFSLHYQPLVELGSGAVYGAEALLRWKHPEKGLISPAEFIPVAEETGQIMAIGEWVLRTACAQLASWRRAGMHAFPISVNLSLRQLRQSNLVQTIRAVLAENGLTPGDLNLEITEGMMMDDAQKALAFLTEMSEMGVHLSIDDFGTGYSSLSYLKNLPVDKLKIDRSFVRDIASNGNDAAIAHSIITLGHHFNLRVVAEGAETSEQMDFLRTRGCDEVQGYFYSRPLPAAEFARFVAEHEAAGAALELETA